MKQLINQQWWEAAGIRAFKTICQTAIATISTASVLEQVDWRMVASASLLAGLLSLLTSVTGLPELNTCDVNDSEESISEDQEIDNGELPEDE